MEKLLQTPSQTVGPYFAYGLTPEQYGYELADLFPTSSPEATCRITGVVRDGAGEPIPDALVEIWQEDGERTIFGRCGTGTDPECRFAFNTEKPCAFDGNAPFLTVIVFMRGQLIHSFTRLYFSDEADSNATDPVLQSVPAERRHTLLAQRTGDGYQFDIWMQGPNETVFFDY